MKVWGSSSQTSLPLMKVFAASALKRVSRERRVLPARLSTSQKPALFRVCSYSGPGLPRPTMRGIDMLDKELTLKRRLSRISNRRVQLAANLGQFITAKRLASDLFHAFGKKSTLSRLAHAVELRIIQRLFFNSWIHLHAAFHRTTFSS